MSAADLWMAYMTIERQLYQVKPPLDTNRKITDSFWENAICRIRSSLCA
jgi:hypothetical protein